ncbi:hypothetical protein PSHT_10353 [Puccinia striiformis]|uniref:Uncharacterized protein n=1 Tax=Puccinia striiformis TaxID=27350 RepID=A0A2S4VAR4_9BASI|nr:hypothetical protein PSHT_10353 [Puccinia striiformis]
MSFPSRRVGPADDRMRPDDAAIRHHPTLADHIARHRAQERVTQELLEQLRRNINLSANATVRHIQRANTSSAQTPTNNTNQDPTYTQMALTLQSLVDMDKRLRNLFDAVIPEAGRINALNNLQCGILIHQFRPQTPTQALLGQRRNLLKTNSRQDLNVFRESNGLANQVDRERIYALLHRIEYGTNNHTPNQVDHLSHPMGMGVGSVQANPEALASNLSVPGSVSPSRPSSMRIEVDPIRSSDRHKRT